MSRLTDLLGQLAESNPALADDLRRETSVLASRRPFGLNFERHVPETVQLYGRKVRRGDKVRVRAPRGTAPAIDQRTWIVSGFEEKGDARKAVLVSRSEGSEVDIARQPVTELVVVAEFRDPIYPGLRSVGAVRRGGDKPHHVVINGENFHVLEALTFACRGQVDCIYIDPPYNSGARDWKYNNDYVDLEDAYRHSKWLAMMERRLAVAKELLRPEDSVLIVTIDEHEVHRFAFAAGADVAGGDNPDGHDRGEPKGRRSRSLRPCGGIRPVLLLRRGGGFSDARRSAFGLSNTEKHALLERPPPRWHQRPSIGRTGNGLSHLC